MTVEDTPFKSANHYYRKKVVTGNPVKPHEIPKGGGLDDRNECSGAGKMLQSATDGN